MPLTSTDFNRFFLARKNGTYKCVFCGHEIFSVNVTSAEKPSEMALLHLAVIDPPGTVTHSGHTFYSITCSNCARSDFFHQYIVDAWVLSNPVVPEQAAAPIESIPDVPKNA